MFKEFLQVVGAVTLGIGIPLAIFWVVAAINEWRDRLEYRFHEHDERLQRFWHHFTQLNSQVHDLKAQVKKQEGEKEC